MSAQSLPVGAPVGQLLRDWRMRRRRSQLDLALDAQVSTRHLSFVETGRARPSRELLLSLGRLLELPLRECNQLLLAAGFAPRYAERALDAPPLREALSAVERVLQAHHPYPAVAVDRHWNLLRANAAANWMLAQVDPALLEHPNVLRISLHPRGMAPAIVNLAEWRHHILERLRGQVARSHDAGLAALLAELSCLPPLPGETREADESPLPDVVMFFRLRTPVGEVRLFSTITVFGTPVEVTLSELALEAFYPADAESAERLRRLAEAANSAAR